MLNLSKLFLFISIFLGASFASAAPVVIAHELPPSHPVSKSIDWFAAELGKRTGMEVQVYNDGKLGNETALMKLVQDGSIAITKVGASLVTNYSDDYKVLALPYLFRDRAQYDKVLQGPIGKKMLAETKEVGFVGLAFLDAGSRSFYTSKAIETPDDLKGLKIRVQNSQLSMDMVKALGGTPVPIAYSELYSALSSGIVDGAENNIPSFFSSKHYEVKKFYSYDKHTMVPDVLIASTAFWDSLSESDKAIFQAVADETVKVQEKNWSDFVGSSIEKLQASGVTFVDSNIPMFQEAVKPVYTKFILDHPKQEAILQQIQSQ